MYIITYKARRKNARRHILEKANNLSELANVYYSVHKNKRYIYNIYDGSWHRQRFAELWLNEITIDNNK